MIDKLLANPKRLFLIDGMGALLSAFLLGVVLVQLESVFGIPSTTLYVLAALAVLFAAYDFYAYRTKNIAALGKLLKGIAIINVLYCCLSIGLALYHIDAITVLGWAYVVVEVLIVVVLAVVELKVAGRLLEKRGVTQ